MIEWNVWYNMLSCEHVFSRKIIDAQSLLFRKG